MRFSTSPSQKEPGNRPGPNPAASPTRGPSAILQAQVKDLEQELRAVRKKERWHFVWALTGLSPAAIIPAMGLYLQGSLGLIVPAILMVTFSEFYLGAKAAGKAARLKRTLEGLREELNRSGLTGDSPH